jgi:hypothetical protein
MSLNFANNSVNGRAGQRTSTGRTVVDARGRTVGFIAPRAIAVAFGSTTDVLPADAFAMNCDPYNHLGRTCAEMIYKRLR